MAIALFIFISPPKGFLNHANFLYLHKCFIRRFSKEIKSVTLIIIESFPRVGLTHATPQNQSKRKTSVLELSHVSPFLTSHGKNFFKLF